MTCEADWQYAAPSIVRFSADQVVRCHSFLHHQHHSTFSSAAFEAGSTVLDWCKDRAMDWWGFCRRSV